MTPEPKREPEYDAGHVPMTEEFDSPKHTLPSAAPVIIALVLVAVVLGIVAYVFRAKPVGQGNISDAFAVDIPNQGQVLATVQLSFRNATEKTLHLKTIEVTTNAGGSEHKDEMAPASDFERYFQAFPALRDHSSKPIERETKIPPGQEMSGTVIVGVPITAEQFQARQDLRAKLIFYDHAPVELKK